MKERDYQQLTNGVAAFVFCIWQMMHITIITMPIHDCDTDDGIEYAKWACSSLLLLPLLLLFPYPK
jgi:hypothetical protein